MKKICCCLSLFMIFSSCKKKEAAEEPVVNTTTTGVSPSPGGDFGTFSSRYNVTEFTGNISYADSSVNATFYNSPYLGQSNINAGTVTVNSVTLTSFANNVYSATNQVNLKNLAWQISGSGTITAASFSYSPTHPVFTGASSFPDTITKSNGVSFTINGVSNTDRPLVFTIGQGSAVITKTFSSTPAFVNISASELNAFNTNTTVTMYLSLFNYSHIVVNATQYGINANRTHLKYAFMK